MHRIYDCILRGTGYELQTTARGQVSTQLRVQSTEYVCMEKASLARPRFSEL
jgi:hypothetical protein